MHLVRPRPPCARCDSDFHGVGGLQLTKFYRLSVFGGGAGRGNHRHPYGKSRLARSLYGFEHTLVVDVQHADHPDLKGYRRDKHTAVLLDEVASPEFIVGNKKVLQAHVDGAILGQSATQLWTYEVFLWRTPLMLTTNNYDYSDFSASDVNWIETNTVAVYIGEPVWDDSAIKPPASPKRENGRRAWGSSVKSSPEHKRLRGDMEID